MTPEQTAEMADMARRGLHDLNPYWSPDYGFVDPLDDPDVRAEVRRYIGRRWRELAQLKATDEARYRAERRAQMVARAAEDAS